MYYNFLVKIPSIKGKISFQTRKNNQISDSYVNYEYARLYKPDKKYNVPKRIVIGKISKKDPTLMYPNQNYIQFFNEDGELIADENFEKATAVSSYKEAKALKDSTSKQDHIESNNSKKTRVKKNKEEAFKYSKALSILNEKIKENSIYLSNLQKEYEAAIISQDKLLKEQKEQQEKELLKKLKESKKTFEEIMTFLID